MTQSYLDIQNAALGNDFDPNVYRTLTKQSILDALGEIARSTQMPANEDTATIATIAAQASYTLPATNIRLLEVFDANGTPLSNVGYEDIDQTVPAAAGNPTMYGLYGGQILFSPTPAAAQNITVRYLGATGLPASDTDLMVAATGVPEDYLYGLVAFARARLFEKEDDTDMATYWQGRWQAAKLALKADVQRRDRSRVRQIPGMFAGRRGPTFHRP